MIVSSGAGWSRVIGPIVAVCFLPAAAVAQLCPGDLNNDNQVTVDEIVMSVNSALSGCPPSVPRFMDNGDNTVTDILTGLTWEKKLNLDGSESVDPHDADNQYTWSDSGVDPDGSAFVYFLARLNTCTSPDGTHLTGGFAGHCDWRLPTVAELQTILLSPLLCTTHPCIDPIFGPTQSAAYWSSTPRSADLSTAWFVDFNNGEVEFDIKYPPADTYVRAVRGGR